MTARLPIPEQDDGIWGNILNDFLSQSLAVDGILKTDSVGTTQVKNGSITGIKLDAGTQTILSSVASKAPSLNPTFTGIQTLASR